MYAKLVNGNLHPAPTCLWDGSTMYANPTEETLLRLGYLPVREEEMPEMRDGWYWEPRYEVIGGEIVQSWVEKEAVRADAEA